MHEQHTVLAESLFGRNTTLFNAVAQHANIDTLRALAVVSKSTYVALQRCQFDHLTMVILESPLKPTTNHLSFNYDPPHITNDKPEFAVDDETLRSVYSGMISQQGEHYLHIPDYARQLMARTRQLTLIIYRRFLGRPFSTPYARLANVLKYGEKCGQNRDHPTQNTSPLHCAMCGDNENRHPTASSSNRCQPCYDQMNHLIERHKLDLDDNPDHNELVYVDSAAYSLFGKQYRHLPVLSHAHLHGDDYAQWVELSDVLEHDHEGSDWFEAHHHMRRTTITLKPDGEDTILPPTKRKRKRPCLMPITTQALPEHLYGRSMQLRNLPRANDQSIAMSLDIRMLDYDHFGCAHWGNAIPGCFIEHRRTWTIYKQHRHPPENIHEIWVRSESTHIGQHFPHLRRLRFHFQQVAHDLAWQPEDGDTWRQPLDLCSFLINPNILLPQLTHFGVIGCQIMAYEFAKIAIANANIQTLEIDTGVSANKYSRTTSMEWILSMCTALRAAELQTRPPSRECRKFDFILAFGNVPTERWCGTTGVANASSSPTVATIPYNRTIINAQCAEHCQTCTTLVVGINNMLNAATGVEQETRPHSIIALDCGRKPEFAAKPLATSADRQHATFSRPLWQAGDDSGYPTITLNIPSDASDEESKALLAIAHLAQRCRQQLSIQCGYCAYYYGLPMFPTPQKWASTPNRKRCLYDTWRNRSLIYREDADSLPYGAPNLASGFRQALAFRPHIQIEFP